MLTDVKESLVENAYMTYLGSLTKCSDKSMISFSSQNKGPGK